MKKKILVIFLCLSACIACALGFSACNLFESGDDSGGEHTHTLVHYEEKTATCAAEGSKEYWYCNTCGEYFSDGNGENRVTVSSLKIPRAAHTEVIDEAVPKTCTTAGKTAGKHCSVCNAVIVAQQTVPAGHIEVIIEAIPKTCTYAGSTEGRKCSVCGEVTLESRIIPASHTLVTDEGKAATCTADGLTDGKHCTECDYVEEQTAIPATGHTEVVDEAVEPTCTANGKTAGKHCGECSLVIEVQTPVPATGHTEVIDAAVEAGCLTQGLTAGKHCTVCGETTLRQQFIPAKGHSETAIPAVAATCSAAGKTEGKICSQCNTVIVAQTTIPKLSHTGSGNLCSTCGELLVAASTGLTFEEVTEMPYEYTSVVGRASSRSVEVIGVFVTGIGTCRDANLVIPSTHNGLPVLGIAGGAFANYDYGDRTHIPLDFLQTVTIPYGVLYVGGAAFNECSNIREVNIADSVEVIGSGAFRSLPLLTSFKCPANLKELIYKQLVSDTALRYVIINASIKEVDIVPFTYCTAFRDVYFEGTEEQWNQAVYSRWNSPSSWSTIDIDVPNVSFYSETAPTGSGNYWHYAADGVTPVSW